MKIVNSTDVSKAANRRVPTPFYKLKTMRFPTTREIQEAFVEIQSVVADMPAPLMDRFFPQKDLLATEVEMYVMRQDSKGYVGMTFPTTPEADLRTFDIKSRVDLAKASWSPINFKETKAWGEIEMLELGRLVEDVQTSQFNGQIAEFMAIMTKRMRTRKEWMCWNLLKNGKLILDTSTPDNPNRLKYEIDYGVTDHVLDMPVKFDDKDGSGKSLLDPMEWVISINRAAKFTGRKLVEIIVNSNFVEYLADNTFVRTLIDYDRGATTLELVNPPRSFYRERALDTFKRYCGGLTVTFNDDTYEDATGQSHYYFEDGQALLLYGNSGALGNFVNTAHVMGAGADGSIQVGTGEYMFAHDNTKTIKPTYEVVCGFNGLPQLTGYDPIDFGYHRFKWTTFARNTQQNPALPKRPDISGPL